MTDITRHNITLPHQEEKDKLVFTLLNVFSPEECQEWIGLTEQRGYGPALVNTGVQQVLMRDVRNSDRCMIDDPAMAQLLFDRIKGQLPQEWKGWKLVGLNERLRFLRYDKGQYFAPHYDGEYRREDGSGERSFITVQLYLNDGYEGGETTLVHRSDPTKNVRCKPETGMVLIFEHVLLHEGSELLKGRKYTLRTDVMYRPV